MPKKKDEEAELYEDEHSSFMEALAATRAEQDRAAQRLEKALVNQIKIANERATHLKKKEDQHKQNEQELAELRIKAKELEVQNSTYEKENKNLEDALRRSENELKQVSESEKKMAARYSVIEKEKETIEREKRALEDELRNLKNQSMTAGDNSIKYQLEAERAKGEAKMLQDQVRALQLENDKLLERTGDAGDVDTIKRLTQQLSEAAAENKVLTDRAFEAEKRAIETDSELKYKDSKIEDLVAENTRLKSQLDELQAELRDSRRPDESLSASQVVPTGIPESTLRDAEKRYEDAMRDLKEANDKLMQANVELADARAENRFHRDSATKMEAQIAELKQELADAKEELARLRAQQKDDEEDKKKYAVNSRAFEFKEDEDDSAAKNAAAADAAKLRLQAELLEAVRKQVALAEEELNSGLSDLAAKDEEWSALQTKLRVADSKIAGLQQQVMSLTESTSTLAAEKASLSRQVADLKDDVNALTLRCTQSDAKRLEVEALSDERAREITRLHELLKLRPDPAPEVVKEVVREVVATEPESAEHQEEAAPTPTLTELRVVDLDTVASPDFDAEEEDDQRPDLGTDSESDSDDYDYDDDGASSEGYYVVDGDDYDDMPGERREYGYFHHHHAPTRPTHGAHRLYAAPPVAPHHGGPQNAGRVRILRPIGADYRTAGPSRPAVARVQRPRPPMGPMSITVPALLRPSNAATRLDLLGEGMLHVGRDGVSFKRNEDGKLVNWPCRVIKKYGDDTRLFSIEVGSIAETGQGIFFFETDQWTDAFKTLNAQMVMKNEELSRQN